MRHLPIIKCIRCYLRPITMDDTNLIVKWRNNPEVRKSFIFREKFTKEIHENWMRTKVESGEVIQYIIVENRNNKPIGSVYYRDINEDYRSAEFGIFIGEDIARGIGLGSEVTRYFVRYGQDNWGLHRIMLRLIEGNNVARKSYLSAGFIQEGVFRDMVYIEDEYKNIVFMAIVDDEK